MNRAVLMLIFFFIGGAAVARDISGAYSSLEILDEEEQDAYFSEKARKIGASAYVRRRLPIKYEGNTWYHEYVLYAVKVNLPKNREQRLELIKLLNSENDLAGYLSILGLNYSSHTPMLIRPETLWRRGLSDYELKLLSRKLSFELSRSIELRRNSDSSNSRYRSEVAGISSDK